MRIAIWPDIGIGRFKRAHIIFQLAGMVTDNSLKEWGYNINLLKQKINL